MHQLFTSIYGRLLLALIVSVLLLAFGNALIFDRIFLTLMLLATLTSFTINKDTFSILTIICLFIGIEELHWYLVENVLTDLNSVWLKIYCYMFCFIGCYLQRAEKITRRVFAIILVAACFEAYWIINDVAGKEIFWHVFIIATVLIGRHVLFWRPHFLHQQFPDITDWTYSRLDADFELFLKLMLLVESLMVAEYLIRYLTNNSQIAYLYYSYSYLAHAINLYLLLSTFLEIKRNYTNRHLQA